MIRWFVIDTLARQIARHAPMARAGHVTLFSAAEIDLFSDLVLSHRGIHWAETQITKYREMMGDSEAPEWLCAPVLYYELRLKRHHRDRQGALLKFRGSAA